MKNSKIIRSLSLLNPEKLHRFQSFVSSGYMNKDQACVDLLEHLMAYYPDLGHRHLVKERVFSKIYPDETFSSSRINKLNHKLFTLFEHFVQCEINSDMKFRPELDLLAYYNDQGWSKHFQYKKNQLEKQFSESVELIDETLHDKYRYEFEVASYETEFGIRKSGIDMETYSRSLDLYYFVSKIEHYCGMLSMRLVLGKEFDDSGLPVLKRLITNSGLVEEPILKIWYNVMVLLEDRDNESLYKELNGLVEIHDKIISQGDKSTIFTLMELIVNRSQIRNRKERFEELFNLYKLQIKTGAIYTNERIHHGRFKNVVTIAVNLKEYDWLEVFMAEHREKLIPETIAEEAFSFNLAYVLYHKGDMDSAAEIILQESFSDAFYRISARRLLLMIHYSAQEWDLLESRMDAHKAFLYRMKGVNTKRVGDEKKFMRNFKKLYSIKRSPNKRSELEDFKSRVATEQSLPERSWLLEQANAI